MLHESPNMVDIDVDHWRNLQDLLLESSKEKRRIIVIHEKGEIQKFVHSQRASITRNVDRIRQPRADAEKIYRDNRDKADFVLVLERGTVDQFFAQVQDSWKVLEDLDVYVHRMYATLDEYPEAIVTYPGLARDRLGLQWRLGARYEDVQRAVERHIPRDSTALFGVFDKDRPWASLVLEFGADKRISTVTTVDPSLIKGGGGWEEISREMVEWVNRKFKPCSLGFFFRSVESARTFLTDKDKAGVFKKLRARHEVLSNPLPATLAQLVAAG